jgi:hypothetical protein
LPETTATGLHRVAAALLGLALMFAAATDYIPAFIDAEGRVFGLFYLDVYKDALHVVSGLWAFSAAAISRSASEQFLKIFGTLYFLDGVVGVITGSSYLDLSLFIEGVRNTPQAIKFLSSIPHLTLGAFGILTGWMLGRLSKGRFA